MGRKLVSIRAVVCALLFAGSTGWHQSQSLFAQLPVGTILGVVRDSSGAVIPGASVTATNSQTGLVRATEASGNGRYTLAALPVGVYDVKAEAASFAAQLKQGLLVKTR